MTSCDWFDSKEARTQKLVEEELQEIDWNDVDQYPLFNDCDETAGKAEQRECFQNTLLLHFSMALQDFEFVANSDMDDSIYVDFLVDREGAIAILDIGNTGEIKEQLPDFDTIITQSLKSLPKIDPALKRGIPVNVKLRIPIVLNTN